MRPLRNLARSRLRTVLTITGITVGIWALVVFGSMANKINELIDGGTTYYSTKVVVSDAAGGQLGSAPMSIGTLDAIRKLPETAVAFAEVSGLLDPTQTTGFGVPQSYNGNDPGADQGREVFVLHAAQGRLLDATDAGLDHVVLGSDLARQTKKAPGDSVTIHDVPFAVVGVLEPTLTAPDTSAQMPLAAAQRLYAADLPQVLRDRIPAAELATDIVVFPQDGVTTDALAAAIKAAVPGVVAMTGADFDRNVKSSTAIFSAIIMGVALISLLVGGLSVINTMAMSVAERTREIGIKRAIGGSRVRVVRELVTEAGLIGLIGGLAGLTLGALVILLANDAGKANGTILFDLTPATAITAILFATLLGMAAGVVPSIHAARLDPVAALRYE